MKRDRVNEVKKVLAVGVWVDGNGNGHLNVPQILEHFGFENTPENHQMVVDMVAAMLKKEGNVPIYRKDPNDLGTVL